MTLVEVMVAVVILTVSVYLLSSTITAAIAHSDVKRERTIAVEACMNVIERMHSQPFDALYALYNEEPADDPGGAGTAPGRHFPVEGLVPTADDPDGLAGEVVMASSAAALREDALLPALSMPRDLNGDLIIDDQDHSGDYIVLPMTIRVIWDGRGGRRTFEMSTMFADLKKVED